MADEEKKGGGGRRGASPAVKRAREEAEAARNELKQAKAAASASRKRLTEEAEGKLKKANDAARRAREDAKEARGGRILGHFLFNLCAVGSTMAGEAIGDSKLGETLDSPIKKRAPLAAVGALVAVAGPMIGLSERVSDGIGMGLMAPADVALGELAYQKVKEAAAT